MPFAASEKYGAPSDVYLNITFDRQTSGMGHVGEVLTASIELILIGKDSTMIGESLMFTFAPSKTIRDKGAWALDVLGSRIDPENVQAGGNQFNHGVWGGATVLAADGHSMRIETLDAPNMNPMTKAFPFANPLPAGSDGLKNLGVGSVFGIGVNLHNNLWNTNYPLFYPYFDPQFCESPVAGDCRNANMSFRFQMQFE